MAIGATTAALIGTGASLAGGLFGAHKQSQAAGQANKANEAASAQAIALQREEMAAQKAQWEQRQAQLAPYLAARASVMAKYGIKIPTGSAGAGAPMAAQGPSSLSALGGLRPKMLQAIPDSAQAMPVPGGSSLSSLEMPDWSKQAWMGRA